MRIQLWKSDFEAKVFLQKTLASIGVQRFSFERFLEFNALLIEKSDFFQKSDFFNLMIKFLVFQE